MMILRTSSVNLSPNSKLPFKQTIGFLPQKKCIIPSNISLYSNNEFNQTTFKLLHFHHKRGLYMYNNYHKVSSTRIFRSKFNNCSIGVVVNKKVYYKYFIRDTSKVQKALFSTSTHTLHGHHRHTHRENFNDPNDKEKEEKAVRQVTWLGLWSNIALSIGKGIAGTVGNSSAMIADAVHSLSDTVSDFVTLWAVHASHKPRDESHPYGTGRYETVGTFVVSTLLVGAGVGIGLHSFEHIMHPPTEIPSQLAIIAAFISIISKEALYHITVRIGEKARSNLLIANAWHHRSDSFSSIVALIGVGGAMLGVPVLDPIAGMAVAALISKLGIQTALDSVVELADKAVGDEELASVGKVIKEVDGVLDFHQLRLRRMGTYSLVDTHISVYPWSSVSAGHSVATNVMRVVKEHFPHIEEVLVHVDPKFGEKNNGKYDLEQGVPLAWRHMGHPNLQLQEKVINVLGSLKEIESATGFNVHHIGTKVLVEADINLVEKDVDIVNARHIASIAKKKLMKEIPTIDSVQLSIPLVKHSLHEQQSKKKEE